MLYCNKIQKYIFYLNICRTYAAKKFQSLITEMCNINSILPLNISKITRGRNIFYTEVSLKGDLKVQFSGKGLRVVLSIKAFCIGITFECTS